MVLPARTQGNKSFLVLFFKKELLALPLLASLPLWKRFDDRCERPDVFSPKHLTCFVILLCSLAFHARAAAHEQDTGGSSLDFARVDDANRAARHGRYTAAIAVVSRALDSSPRFAAGYLERATLYMDAGRYPEALADLDRVIAMHPDAAAVFVLRADIALRQRAATQALADLGHAAALPAASFWKQNYQAGHNDPAGGQGLYYLVSDHLVSRMFAYSSIAHELQGKDEAALDDLRQSLVNETLYPWHVLGRHCYTAALAGLLDMAELTCTEAIDKQTHDEGAYDTRGLVYLKMHQWDKAIADYDRALRARPDLTVALYGRGLARHATGDRAGGDADIAAATQGEPDIANIMTRLGVQPL